MMWMDQAACAGIPTDIFFPAVGESALKAKAICATCPVIEDCRRYAQDVRAHHGIFGGLTSRERYIPRKPPRHGTRAKYRNGCHCQPCREANTRYNQRRRVSA